MSVASRRLRPRTALTGALLAGMLLSSWMAPALGLAPSSKALAASTDLTLVTDTIYTVQPEQHRVRVGLSIVARNNTKESRTRRFYFDHAFLAVMPGVSDLHIAGAKGARVRVAKHSATSTLLRIDFGARLYSGKSRTLKVTYSLVDKGGPVGRDLRVGTSLVTMPVWAYASNGARGSTVRVRFPAGYDVTVEHGSFDHRSTLAGGGVELATGKLSSPLGFFAYVSAQRPPLYADTPLTVPAGDESIALTMRAWKDDPAWATRVGDVFAKSLPILRVDIGLPWPSTEALVVQQGASRDASGYEGLFDPAAHRIEIAYWADHQLIVHEAAHGWFNGSLLADRWANEGFATFYGLRAATAIKEKVTAPALSEAISAAAIPLNAWEARPAADATTDPEQDAAARASDDYGYAASFALATAIADRAGDDTLRAVWADAAAGTGAYQPVDPGAGMEAPGVGTEAPGVAPERVDGPPDWRGLLDLLEARTGADFTDLWRQWVVRPDEASLLDARAAARLAYSRTIALAGGWALPRSIRDAMRAWQFDLAEQLMADARTVLAQRGAVTSLAEQRGFTLPNGMQASFEGGDMVAASAHAEAERNAMLAIDQADDARSAEHDILTRIGMLGENPEAELDIARAALAAGEIDHALQHADDAYRAWSGAWQEGRRRALLAVAVLATLVVLASAVIGRLRASRREPVAQATRAARRPRRGRGPVVAEASGADVEPTAEELLAAATPPPPPGA